ncbi:MAG: LamG domain-containing protein, partial [Anaerohalosphaera sp.]|nr:LamG domain-containing protein [Anaerohalosphaera sp.]
MWVKAGTSSVYEFFAAFNTPSGDNRLMFGHSGSSSILSVHDGYWRHSDAVFFDETWHHAAFVLSDSTDEVFVYVDGEFVYSYATATSIAAGDVFSLGQEYDAGLTTSDFFDGQLDDVRVYNKVLSEAEIQSLGQL